MTFDVMVECAWQYPGHVRITKSSEELGRWVQWWGWGPGRVERRGTTALMDT